MGPVAKRIAQIVDQPLEHGGPDYEQDCDGDAPLADSPAPASESASAVPNKPNAATNA